ncbi:MAG: 1-deoxy-D-xylulose-5-phosphate reductoisomerase [Maricaulaceae bacterium]
MTRRITVLGATGSIGDSTLDLVRRAETGVFQVVALSANQNVDKLVALAKEFNAEFVALGDEAFKTQLKAALAGTSIEYGVGADALIEAGRRPTDFSMAAIIGAAGLEPTLAAVAQGNTVGLANKECLVCAGDLFMAQVKAYGTTLLPIDSEHNAIFQVLEHDKPEGVKRLILTASGGPFRETPMRNLSQMTPQQALKHPTWTMGAKITIDSATLINKGLELIEAAYLFDRPEDEIGVVVHPQSIIHSMVEYIDGSVLAQMGSPDMRTPIAYALGWPDRMSAPVEPLDLVKIGSLSFFEPDMERFPGLALARDSLKLGGQAPNVFNAANEVAVEAFLNKRIGFMDIPAVVEKTLSRQKSENSFGNSLSSVEDIISCDKQARLTANDLILTLKS